MSKLKLKLFVEVLGIKIEAPVYVYDEKSWRGTRAAIRSGCLGGHSRSAYFLAGSWRPHNELGSVPEGVILFLEFRSLTRSEIVVKVTERYEGTFIRESVHRYLSTLGWEFTKQLLIDTIES